MNTRTLKSGIYYHANVTTDRSGRMSIVVYEGTTPSYGANKKIVDVELPMKSKKGLKEAGMTKPNEPRVIVAENIEVYTEDKKIWPT